MNTDKHAFKYTECYVSFLDVLGWKSLIKESVLHKCCEDRSIAIAHVVEDFCWKEVEFPIVRRGKKTGESKTEWHQKIRLMKR